MKIKYQTTSCSNCGTQLSITTSNGTYLYGSPIRHCPKCNKSYLDPNYHEIEIDGIRECDISNKGVGGLLLGSLVATVIFGLLFIFFLNQGRLHLGLLIAIGISILVFIYTIYDAIKIKTGAVQNELEQERHKSILRLQNTEYAHTLKNLGYNVPEKYL